VPFTVSRASPWDKLLKTGLWYLYLPFLALYLRWWRADLIWIDESIPLAGLIVEFLSGCRTALTVADFFMEVYREKHPWLAPLSAAVLWLDKCAWKRSVCLITRAESTKQYLIAQGIDASSIHVLRDAFKLEVFKPARNTDLRRRYGFGPDDVVLCHHGILHPNKGIERALIWLAPVMREDPRLKFLVIGGGGELPALKATVGRENLLQQVIFTGWLPNSREVAEHLNSSDIGLVMRVGQFTDHFHVTGTLIHCLMCGLPVLAARLEGISEIVTEGVEGCLFKPDSKEEFLGKLALLKTNAALRAQMGEAGRRRAVDEFNPQSIIENTLKTLRSSLG
jgi:phosphatidylinositol alpha-1,6-mannosyltransferase